MSKRKVRSEIKHAASAASGTAQVRAMRMPAAGRQRTRDLVARLLPMLLLAIGLAAYHNSFNGEFLLDDIGRVVQNPHIRTLWPLWDVVAQSRRPIVELSAAINFALGGLDVRGYHVFNLAVHLAAGLILFGIVRRTFETGPMRDRYGNASRALASTVAAIWLVHPLQTAAVTYVSQRAESLMGFFYLLTVYCGMRGIQSSHSRPWFAAAICACALGMGSKEVMVTAPLLMLVYDRTFLAMSFDEIARKRWAFYAGLCATWLILAALIATSRFEEQGVYVADVTAWRYALAQFEIIVHYVRLALWPHPLVFDYMWPLPQTIASVLPYAAIVIALVVTTVVAVRRVPWIGFWGVWFFLILAPSSSIVPIADLAFEHRMYLPLVAVIVLAVLTVHRALAIVFARAALSLHAQRWIPIMFASLIVTALAVTTVRRNGDYATALAMWGDTVAKRPDNSRAHFNFAIALHDHRRTGDAIREYNEALRLKPDFAEAYFGLGIAEVARGKLDQGVGYYREAMRLEPADPRPHFNSGVALAMQGKTEAAVAEYAEAVRLGPELANAQKYLGAGLAALGKMAEALPHLQKAQRLSPNDAEVRRNVGLVLVHLGRNKEAIRAFEEAVRLQPRYREAMNDLNDARARERREAAQ